MAFCLASHAFVSGRSGLERKPTKTGYEVQRGNAAKLFDDASDLLWSATGQALSVGATLGMVFAVTQASVRAEEMKAFGDLESQVTVAKIDRDIKVKELKADAQKVDEFTKSKVRTSEEKFREFTKDFDTKFASTERSIRAGPGVRSVVRKSLQKEKPSGITFTGFEGLPSLPALPALPSLSLPGLGGGSGGAPPTEDAALGVLSGAAISLGVPAVLAAGAVNNRIQEKKREDAERKAREKVDSAATGSILTAVAGIGAAVVVGNFILTNLPAEAPPKQAPSVQTTTTQSADTAAAEKAAAAKAAADKAAAEKAAADKAAADKAAADKAAADKAAADQAAADKAAADKAAADKAAADQAAADKAAADQAAADKAAADKAAADKAAADKAAADKAAADKAAADKAAADKAAADKAAAAKVETPAAPESTTAKIAKKGGYFAYMKEKRQQ
ncbi:unnamed protein product [Cladocopium goreaui]|uniref:Peptidoglycan hydrolase n=1 Tax=Cladocopium goreaui TaxID=2562237 RepID=A0A9P1BXV1_9DINO|nr:unnamed protein product [Cladocopium goreaui]